MRPAPPTDVAEQVARALAEDVGSGDLTAALIPADRQGHATVITREAAVVCGVPYVDATFARLDPGVRVQWHVTEGAQVAPNQVLFELRGAARALLTGERTSLNFLQFLSGTATAARIFADLLEGTGCRLLDTRKTIPGLRVAQKYAVRVGGGHNHRIGLFDGVLIKENHIMAAGSIAKAVASAQAATHARGAGSRPMIEVEVETLAELREAVAAGPDIVMLDEFSLADTRTAVALNRAAARPVKLEASGRVSRDTIREIGLTGVDYISVGSITKNVCAIDLSMRFDWR